LDLSLRYTLISTSLSAFECANACSKRRLPQDAAGHGTLVGSATRIRVLEGFDMSDDLDRLDAEYETAEAAFLAAIRRHVPRTEVAGVARAVAEAAAAYNNEAYRCLHISERDEQVRLDWLTERTEILSELWADIADAFGMHEPTE
jgi:hypothetical protein